MVLVKGMSLCPPHPDLVRSFLSRVYPGNFRDLDLGKSFVSLMTAMWEVPMMPKNANISGSYKSDRCGYQVVSTHFSEPGKETLRRDRLVAEAKPCLLSSQNFTVCWSEGKSSIKNFGGMSILKSYYINKLD